MLILWFSPVTIIAGIWKQAWPQFLYEYSVPNHAFKFCGKLQSVFSGFVIQGLCLSLSLHFISRHNWPFESDF